MEYKYYLLNKPLGVVCSTVDSTINDPKYLNITAVHITIYDYIKEKGIILTNNLHPIGRLDVNTNGVIVITDDKKLLKLIRNPIINNDTNTIDNSNPFKEKEYILTLLGKKSHKLWNWNKEDEERMIEKLSEPFTFNLHNSLMECSRSNITFISIYQDKEYMRGTDLNFLGWCLKVKVIISEGKNRQIRRIASRQGFKVLTLTRTKIAQILDINSVPNEGDIRELSEDEIQTLYKGFNQIEH